MIDMTPITMGPWIGNDQCIGSGSRCQLSVVQGAQATDSAQHGENKFVVDLFKVGALKQFTNSEYFFSSIGSSLHLSPS